MAIMQPVTIPVEFARTTKRRQAKRRLRGYPGPCKVVTGRLRTSGLPVYVKRNVPASPPIMEPY